MVSEKCSQGGNLINLYFHLQLKTKQNKQVMCFMHIPNTNKQNNNNNKTHHSGPTIARIILAISGLT